MEFNRGSLVRRAVVGNFVVVDMQVEVVGVGRTGESEG